MLFDPNSENCDKYCLSALTHLKKNTFHLYVYITMKCSYIQSGNETKATSKR